MAIDLDVHGNTKPLEAAVQAAINRIRRQPIKITVDDKGATQPLGNMKRAADEFSKSMEAANARILAFGASMAIINGVADAFKGMVRNLVEVEKSLADINVVMGLSTQNLDKFGDGLFKVAKETGAAFRVAADAATEYARQGLAMEETLKRTRDALVLTRLTGMDSAEAVKSLTAAMNTYGNQIKDTTQLVSKFAAVDVQFAVSAEDFAAAISRTGQAARSAGVDIDELIGIVTSAQQQTARGGAVIGNALKTIFTKTGRTDTLNQLENLGIAVRDLEGNTIGAKRILSDLANTFDTLSEAQKAQITQTMGGLFHINILKAVLSDAAKQNGILANATQISANATDEAIQKNEQLRATMSAMAGETGNAIKQLSVQIGELMLAPGMEKILNTVKSLAEGASDILGDGESAGNQFANGFLKGLGNVITGPGLVVLTTVFVKLFMTAAKFTKESLSSLIGVTSEAQKQKAIQTSLVTLIGQNAALGKEMLRTDISRTEKEKILLGLLRMQTAEAENLNRISKQLASTLYTKGYGPGLTTGKRRAYGHIPNFADPERAQAAKGGYAAGSIRTMNMPGEGSVIYNSAETVKNFAGFKQPAIMPPQSSKAGKNYQQAFGSIHGFDPYAAGGYIPNYAAYTLLKPDRSEALYGKKGDPVSASNWKQSEVDRLIASGHITKVTTTSQLKEAGGKSLAAMLVPKEGYLTGGTSSYGTGKNKMTWPVYTLRPDINTKPKDLSDSVKSSFESIGSQYASSISKAIGGNTIEPSAFWSEIEKDSAGGGKGAWKAAVGAIFEGAVNAALDYEAGKRHKEEGDFDVRKGKNLKKVQEVFEGFPAAMTLADYKSDSASKKNRKSFRDKIVKQGAFEASQKKNKARTKAYGHIPNFADPLSDAIGREKAAGVPVSQIRVGSHSALMSKGNPLGLGVTNTYDEPNGLRDVFGANGFVPNYAPQFREQDFNKGSWAMNRKYLKKANKMLESWASKLQEGLISKDQYNKYVRMASRSTIDQVEVSNRIISESKRYNSALGKATNSIKSAYGAMTGGFAAANKKFENTAMGRSLAGGGGMGLMVGAPMLAGMLQQGGPAEGGIGYKAGGALMGAGTGASIGMLFGPLGIAIGGVIGAFKGLADSIDQVKIAQEKQIKENAVGFAQSFPLTQIAQNLSKSGKIGSMTASQLMGGGNEGQYAGKTVFDILSAQRPELSSEFLNLGSGVLGEDYYKKDPQGKFIRARKNPTSKLGKFFNMGLLPEDVYSMMPDREKAVQEYNKFYEDLNVREEAVFAAMKDLGEMKEFLPDIVTTKKNGKEVLRLAGAAEGKGGEKSYQQFAKEIKESGFIDTSTEQGVENLNELIRLILAKNGQILKTTSDQQKTIILQLNLQKAQIQAQQAAVNAQLDIKSKFLSQSKMLDTQEKLMGGLMTEQQKAQMQYNKSLLKASEAYESGAAQADAAFKTGVLQDIGQNPALQSALKSELFKGQDAKDVSVLDLTQALSTKSAKELEDILERIGNKHNKANEILTNRGLIYRNLLDTLGRQKDIAEGQASSELKINQILADRKQLLEDMTNRMKDFNDESDFLKKEAALDRRILDAQRAGTGRYVSKSEQLSRDRAKMQEDIIPALKRQGISGKKGILSEYAGKLNIGGFSAEEESQILAMGRDADISEIVKAKKAREFEEANRGGKMQQLTNQLNQFAPLSNERFEELTGSSRESVKAQLESLVELDKARTGRNKDLNEEIERGNRALKRQNILNEKNVDAVKAEQKAREDIESGRGFASGFRSSMDSMQDRIKDIDEQLGRDIPFAFADGMANAMTEALNGTKNIKDALTDAAISFLGMIQKAMMQKAAYSIVGAMGFSRGGNVRNYSRGGGVPAMVSNGEYVMGRDAVAKYGGSFMHSLNAGGKIPGFSGGGGVEADLLAQGKIRRESNYAGPGAAGSALAANFGGGRGFKSGRQYQRRAMSGFFYAQSGNVGLGEDTAAIGSILQEEERRRQEAEARRQAKKAKRRQLLGMVLGTIAAAGISSVMQGGNLTGTAKAAGYGANTPAGVNMAIDSNGMAVSTLPGADLAGSGLTNITPTRSFNPLSWRSPSTINPALGPFFYDRRYLGGPIRKYASGGYISGKSGIDQIPAMLSEGEYVIRASSARQLGKPMLDRINAGKFNEGGAVSELMGSSETAASGGNTNNINISINMERGSGSKKENQSQDNSGQNPADRSSDEQNNAQLAERIKQQVVAVIVEEQRPGGLLSE